MTYIRLAWALPLLAALLALPLALSVYLQHLVNTLGIYLLVVLGLNFILGLAGEISFAQVAFWGIGAYTAALLTHDANWAVWLAMVASGLVPAALAVVVGVALFRLRGHYLGFATIGVVQITFLVLLNWRSLTHGPDGVTNVPSPSLFGWELNSEPRIYYLVLAAAVLATYVALRVTDSRFGRALVAIRESEVAASAIGVNTHWYKVAAFSLSALYAGVSGSLLAHLNTYVSPDMFTFDQSVVFLVMLMIGGAGSVWGALIGTALLAFLPEWLRFLKDYYMLIYGIGVVLMMVRMPTGTTGWLRAQLARRHAVKVRAST